MEHLIELQILFCSFFDSSPLLNTLFGGANSIMRGLCQDAAETADTTFNDDIHNFLFRPSSKMTTWSSAVLFNLFDVVEALLFSYKFHKTPITKNWLELH